MINSNFDKLENNYLFAEVQKRVQKHIDFNPDKPLYKLSIGDVTQPLSPIVSQAICQAGVQMGQIDTFRGYGEYRGCDFLRGQIVAYYRRKGVEFDCDCITVTEGAKSTLGLVLDLFESGIKVCVPDPVYPVYVDTNTIRGNELVYAIGDQQNNFLPLPPQERVDLMYICNPNNPTGAVYTRQQLEQFVDYAIKNKSIIIYDSAYEAFVIDRGDKTTHSVGVALPPSSIYEIEKAKLCAIEICSLSKFAGFSGVRVGFVTIPKQIVVQGVQLDTIWNRLVSTKTNGVSYISQCAAHAALSVDGLAHNYAQVEYYLGNANLILQALKRHNIWCCGGVYAPYVWMQCPLGMTGWQFFDALLSVGVVGTPGEGFGSMGANYFRLSAFAQREDLTKALQIIENLFANYQL